MNIAFNSMNESQKTANKQILLAVVKNLANVKSKSNGVLPHGCMRTTLETLKKHGVFIDCHAMNKRLACFRSAKSYPVVNSPKTQQQVQVMPSPFAAVALPPAPGPDIPYSIVMDHASSSPSLLSEITGYSIIEGRPKGTILDAN